jgi:hypothetical protein
MMSTVSFRRVFRVRDPSHPHLAGSLEIFPRRVPHITSDETDQIIEIRTL